MAQEYLIPVNAGILGGLRHSYSLKGVGIAAARDVLLSIQRDAALGDALEEAADGRSYLGTLVYDELVLGSGQYFDQSDINQETPIAYEGLKIQSVLIEVFQTKNIITTSLQGRNGTVKEYVSDGDFNLTVTGIIIGENEGDLENDPANAIISDIGNFYPSVDVARLNTLCTVPDVITLTSDFLSIFGIAECVVMNYNIPQKEATRNAQPFQINLLSDFPIELNELEVTP